MRWRSIGPIALLASGGLTFLGAPCSGGSPAPRTFASGSLVIPMDNCYQKRDAAAPVSTVNCNAAGDDGVFRAYGLVYLLLKQNFTVYWVIDLNKTSVTATDFTVTVTASPVARLFNWANGTFGALGATAQTTIDYRGGPFVIDAADTAAVVSLITTHADFAPFKTQAVVDIHEVQAGFSVNQARPLKGVPPRIAILNITGSVPAIMQGYAQSAGLDWPCTGPDCAGGVAATGACGCPATGATCNVFGFANPLNNGPGVVYDMLCDNDFLPNFATSNLGKNAYKLLWAPHWAGAVKDPASDATLAAQLNTIAAFVDAGNNLFAECHSIATLEGDQACGKECGWPATRFQSTAGMRWNGNGTRSFLEPPHPNSQIGDFVFTTTGGSINRFYPDEATPSVYRAGVKRLITETNAGVPWDVLTLNNKDNDLNKGVVVYFGGHTYIGQSAGTRLVLDSLFNLGVPCGDPNTPCNTGLFGVCGQGTLKCSASGGFTCVPPPGVSPTTEICDGKDNDCDGQIDEGLSQTCYSGPAGTQGVGACKGGTQICTGGQWSVCQGEIKPGTEQCNGLDDDCNGTVDDLSRPCYDGPPATSGVGPCQAGVQACSNGSWGACTGQVLPAAETCNSIDDNCNGTVDDGTCLCTDGQTRACYSGPPATRNVGACQDGSQTCGQGTWGLCIGEVLPAAETCNNADDNCDTAVDEGGVCTACQPGAARACYPGTAATRNVGVCKDGVETCVSGGSWGACQGATLPGTEACDGKDNDCDGSVDNGAACPGGYGCKNGVCVPSVCGGELSACPVGYECRTSGCEPVSCGASTCPAGQVCQGTACQDPCATVRCGSGATCSAGTCVGGACYQTGCPAGEVCRSGQCVADPCAAATCPEGTFCRAGDCVQSCVYVRCPTGQACSVDGFCGAQAACSPACGAGQVCQGGGCVADPCAGVGCGTGQVCRGGACVDDPCAGVSCRVGSCLEGQCVGEPPVPDGGGVTGGDDGGTPGDGGDGVGIKRGCGCGPGGSAGAMLLLVPAALFGRRRRGRGRGFAWLLAVAAVALVVPPACSGGGGGGDGGGGGGGECDPGLTSCSGICVDLGKSTIHCGACGSACPSGYTCDSAACAFVSKNPFLSAIDPVSTPVGAPATLKLTGERFAAGALVRFTGGGVDGEKPLRVDSATSATLENVDLTRATPGAVEVRVLNPGRLVSNTATLTLTGATEAPILTGVAPTRGKVGTSVALDVAGRLFVASTVLYAAPAGGTGTALPTTVQDATLLKATLDLTAATPGRYDLWARTGTKESNRLAFDAVSAAAAITAVTPASAQTGYTGSLTVDGSGLEAGSSVRLTGGGLATPKDTPAVAIGASQLFVSRFDLTGVVPGSYSVSAVSATGETNKLPFTVISAPPAVSTLSPNRGVKGTQVTLTVTGTNFDATSVVRIAPGTGTGTALPTTFGSTTQLAAGPIDLTTYAIGTYSVFVRSGSVDSNAVAFIVDSNDPTLSQVNPASARQDQTVDLTLTGSGFLSSAEVAISSATMPEKKLATTWVNATTVKVVGLALGTYAVGNYALFVRNAGSNPSAAVGFSVLEGIPTLSSIAPSSAATNTTNFTATLTGTFYYSTSVAHVSGGGITDSPLPTTYVSATQVTVTLNLTGVQPGTYSVTVVNPGPLTSNPQTFTVTP